MWQMKAAAFLETSKIVDSAKHGCLNEPRALELFPEIGEALDPCKLPCRSPLYPTELLTTSPPSKLCWATAFHNTKKFSHSKLMPFRISRRTLAWQTPSKIKLSRSACWKRSCLFPCEIWGLVPAKVMGNLAFPYGVCDTVISGRCLEIYGTS